MRAMPGHKETVDNLNHRNAAPERRMVVLDSRHVSTEKVHIAWAVTHFALKEAKGEPLLSDTFAHAGYRFRFKMMLNDEQL